VETCCKSFSRSRAASRSSPEDTAGAAIYLASRAGDYVVGATLTVHGGVAFGRAGIDGTNWQGE